MQQHTRWKHILPIILLISTVVSLNVSSVATAESITPEPTSAPAPITSEGTTSSEEVSELVVVRDTAATVATAANVATGPDALAAYSIFLPALMTAPQSGTSNAVGTVIEAESATVSGSFERYPTYIMHTTESTDPGQSGRATYTFSVKDAGDYVIKMLVDAPSTSANSLFVAVDTAQVTGDMYWEIQPTSGFQTRTVSYYTSGAADHVFSLSAGQHTLQVVGRERNVKIDQIWLERGSAGTDSSPIPPSNRFGPPTLTNPKTVVITNANPRYFGNGTEDVIVKIAEKMTVPVRIDDVRNMVMIGGEFTITKPLLASLPTGDKSAISQHRALAISNIHGTAYIEGIWINNSGGGLSEGMQTWDMGGMVYIRNSRFEGVRTKANDPDFDFNHPDLLEPMSGSFVLENVTMADSDYQGIIFTQEPGQNIGTIRMYNVNTRNIARQAWFFRDNLDTGAVQACENCWHDVVGSDRPNTPYYSFYPNPDERSGSVVWNNTRQVVNGLSIRLGRPTGGDFVPADRVGRNYDPAYFKP